MQKLLIHLFLLLSCSFLFGQSPIINWQLFLNGNTYRNIPVKVISTDDNGYLVLSSIDQPSYNNTTDCKLVKLDINGNILWQKSIGGISDDQASDIVQTNDGGYIMIGSTTSNDGDVFGNHNANLGNAPDVWVVKMNSSGTIEWQKCLGSVSSDYGRSIKQTIDGGYVIAASAGSNDGDVNGLHSPATSDYWIVKLNSIGTIEWQKCLGGTNSDEVREIIQTTDGGFLIAGETYSNNGDVTLNHGLSDFWIVKTNNVGILEWQKSFGGVNFDIVTGVIQASDLGFIVGGGTYQNSGDFSTGGAWRFLKLDNSGNIIWNKSLLGRLRSSFSQMKINPINNQIFVIGNDYTSSNAYNTNIEVNHLTPDGNLMNKIVFGGTLEDYGVSLDFSTNNDFVVLADVRSTDGNINAIPSYTGNFAHTWLSKLPQPLALSVEQDSYFNKITLFPNPVKDYLNIISEGFNQSEITIFDNLGRLIFNGDSKGRIDLSYLKSGFYIVTIKNETGDTYTQKIIKE